MLDAADHHAHAKIAIAGAIIVACVCALVYLIFLMPSKDAVYEKSVSQSNTNTEEKTLRGGDAKPAEGLVSEQGTDSAEKDSTGQYENDAATHASENVGETPGDDRQKETGEPSSSQKGTTNAIGNFDISGVVHVHVEKSDGTEMTIASISLDAPFEYTYTHDGDDITSTAQEVLVSYEGLDDFDKFVALDGQHVTAKANAVVGAIHVVSFPNVDTMAYEIELDTPIPEEVAGVSMEDALAEVEQRAGRSVVEVFTADYNGNGTEESFVLTGESSGSVWMGTGATIYFHAHLWLVDSKGSVSDIASFDKGMFVLGGVFADPGGSGQTLMSLEGTAGTVNTSTYAFTVQGGNAVKVACPGSHLQVIDGKMVVAKSVNDPYHRFNWYEVSLDPVACELVEGDFIAQTDTQETP